MGDWASKSPIDIPPEFVKKFVMLIVTKLLPLRAADLEKWSDDPEEWMNEEEAERWEFELRVGFFPLLLLVGTTVGLGLTPFSFIGVCGACLEELVGSL